MLFFVDHCTKWTRLCGLKGSHYHKNVENPHNFTISWKLANSPIEYKCVCLILINMVFISNSFYKGIVLGIETSQARIKPCTFCTEGKQSLTFKKKTQDNIQIIFLSEKNPFTVDKVILKLASIIIFIKYIYHMKYLLFYVYFYRTFLLVCFFVVLLCTFRHYILHIQSHWSLKIIKLLCLLSHVILWNFLFPLFLKMQIFQ
jgi:hypothetical protein